MGHTIFEYPVLIREMHLDTFGHVNNATYLQLYEEARWEFITQNGYGLEKIKSTGLGPVVLDLNIRFVRELRLRQKITIYSQTLEYHSKVGAIKQWIIDDEGKICSDIVLKVGLFDTHKRKLVDATPEWIKAVK